MDHVKLLDVQTGKVNPCNPDCYTKDRGCVVTGDGRCLFIFAKQGEPPKSIQIKTKLSNIKYKSYAKR